MGKSSQPQAPAPFEVSHTIAHRPKAGVGMLLLPAARDQLGTLLPGWHVPSPPLTQNSLLQ